MSLQKTTGDEIVNGTQAPTQASTARPQQRRLVLSEEDYSANLSKVIQRNYFPELPRLKAQVAIQQAREVAYSQSDSQERDLKDVIATRRRHRQLAQDEEQALQLEQQDEQNLNEKGHRKRPRPLDHESLTQFHTRVTSEDNASYEHLQEAEQEKRVEKRLQQAQRALQIMGGSSKKNEPNLTPSRLLASDQFNPSPHRLTLTQQETKKQTLVENPLFFTPNPADATAANDRDSGEAAPLLENGDGTTSTTDPPRAALMPPPQAKTARAKQCGENSLVVRKSHESPSDLVIRQSNGNGNNTAIVSVEFIPKQQHKIKIVPAATRFPPPAPIIAARKTSSTALQDAYASSTTDGATDYDSSATTDLDDDSSQSYPMQIQRLQAQKRKAREQESFVEMTPLIVPGGSAAGNGEDNSDDDGDEPIMTWGEVSQTPLALSAAETQQERTAFGVAPATTKEVAAQAALEELQRRGRRAAEASSSKGSISRKTQKDRQKTPRNVPRLFSSSSVRSSSSFGTALRASYSRPSSSIPSSARKRLDSSTIARNRQSQHRTAHAATPLLFKKKA